MKFGLLLLGIAVLVEGYVIAGIAICATAVVL